MAMRAQKQILVKIGGQQWRFDPVTNSYFNHDIEIRKDTSGQWLRSDTPGKAYPRLDIAAMGYNDNHCDPYYRLGAASHIIESLMGSITIAMEKHSDLSGFGIGLEIAQEWLKKEEVLMHEEEDNIEEEEEEEDWNDEELFAIL